MPAKAITPTEVEAVLERIERAALRAPVPIYQRFGGRARPPEGRLAERGGRAWRCASHVRRRSLCILSSAVGPT